MTVAGSSIWWGFVLAVALWQVIRQAQIMRSKDPDIYVGWPFVDGSNPKAQKLRLAGFIASLFR
jgi:hypothetical protein